MLMLRNLISCYYIGKQSELLYIYIYIFHYGNLIKFLNSNRGFMCLGQEPVGFRLSGFRVRSWRLRLGDLESGIHCSVSPS